MSQADRESSARIPPKMPWRYEALSFLGEGATAEVWRVRDHLLGRTAAMKVVHAWGLEDEELLSRFNHEAQITAQLQHPGIISVHDLGELPGGQLFYTMTEVRGETLKDRLRRVHGASSPEGWAEAEGWGLRRLLDALGRVCDAMAYAHSLGIVHRDLKPSNVMVGPFGEVLVLDWGLAKVLRTSGDIEGAAPPRGVPLSLEAAGPRGGRIVTERSLGDGLETVMGQISGTPAYMAPEQARGDLAAQGTWTDVFLLGGILFEILIGVAPGELGATAALEIGALGQMAPIREALQVRHPPPIPEPLVELCEGALAQAPAARFQHAGLLAEHLSHYLLSAERRSEGLQILKEAKALHTELEVGRAREKELRTQAKALGEEAGRVPILKERRVLWTLKAEAEGLSQAMDLTEASYVQMLQTALTRDPDLPEVHASLVAHYLERHRVAEAERRDSEVRQLEMLIRAHDRAGTYTDYLEGHAQLLCTVSPPGAEVLIYAFCLRELRLHPEAPRPLTPGEVVSLPQGSYLLEVTAPGFEPARLPVLLTRQGSERCHVGLLPAGTLGPEEIYAPSAWCQIGGDPNTPYNGPAQRICVDSFVIQARHVSMEDYLAFLNDLSRQGRSEEARIHAPRQVRGLGEPYALMVDEGDGTFRLRPDAEGDLWPMDHPCVGVNWYGAMAYAQWLAERTGKPWRLPGECEWEYCARGADGRFFPWGDAQEPVFANTTETQVGPPSPMAVGTHPMDIGPHGVRDLAGNVGDWVLETFKEMGPFPTTEGRYVPPIEECQGDMARLGEEDITFLKVFRGGNWEGRMDATRAALRHRLRAYQAVDHIGFRCLYSVDFEDA